MRANGSSGLITGAANLDLSGSTGLGQLRLYKGSFPYISPLSKGDSREERGIKARVSITMISLKCLFFGRLCH